MELINTLAAAKVYGSIGTRNSKMPGTAFALPPSKCHVGGKLAAIPGSVCAGCYAVKTERMYTSARKGWSANYEKALQLIAEKPEQWAQALAFQIERYADKFGELHHRWFDAGDLQDVAMLRAIVRVCELTPAIKHWLPTREAKIVADWRAAGGIEPANSCHPHFVDDDWRQAAQCFAHVDGAPCRRTSVRACMPRIVTRTSRHE